MGKRLQHNTHKFKNYIVHSILYKSDTHFDVYTDTSESKHILFANVDHNGKAAMFISNSEHEFNSIDECENFGELIKFICELARQSSDTQMSSHVHDCLIKMGKTY